MLAGQGAIVRWVQAPLGHSELGSGLLTRGNAVRDGRAPALCSLSPGAWNDEAGLICCDDGLSSVAYAQVGEDSAATTPEPVDQLSPS
jgi:hypothetical protein